MNVLDDGGGGESLVKATATSVFTSRIERPVFRYCFATFANCLKLFVSSSSASIQHFRFITILLSIFFLITVKLCSEEAVQMTAILGESVVFNCNVEFPGDHQIPYVLQWEKKGEDIPIYIWYDSYPTHSSSNYEGRVSKVSAIDYRNGVRSSGYGAGSLNLTNIKESDQGWYECNIVFLNRPPSLKKNGTWFFLNVHAPPKFVTVPDDVVYVSLGDAVILTCQASGTPKPTVRWTKDSKPLTDTEGMTGVYNEGTELRISNVRLDDIGDYVCNAKNDEGEISHLSRVIIAGAAVIMVPPMNQTKLEGEKVQFSCEPKAHPQNVTIKWFREGVAVQEISTMDTRTTVKRDGSLVVNPVSADDSGQYLCEVSNGIGEPQSASAFLNVEYPAKVTFTPSIQYLPFRLAGVVHCYIKANPPLQYVTWTKDKRLLEPYQTKEVVIMNNGSLLFTRVNENHQGRYTCTPYNAQGTQGSSSVMEVLVRKPPMFLFEPLPVYQKKLGETVEMYCEAQEAEGTQKPVIQWRRRDGLHLPKNRAIIANGNFTLENLRKSDFGFYQCVATNEVATIVANTQLIVEGTQPHAPYNVTGTATEFAITIQWLPGYSGGPDYKQEYTVWYRESGTQDWLQVPVAPAGGTQLTINRLTPGTEYEFRIAGRNTLGEGMLSDIVHVKTLDIEKPVKVNLTTVPSPTNTDKVFHVAPDTIDISDNNVLIFPTDSTGAILIPPILRPKGPKPGQPRNVTVTEIHNGFLITWEPPLERSHLVQYYTIRYRTDSSWKTLNKVQIRSEDTSFLVGGRTYYFRVLANSLKSYESSEEIKFPVPARVKHKAITAGVVGGLLFFIVAIILSVCAVKICNKRRRRKQEKAYNMVACRITEARNNNVNMNSADNQVPLKKLKLVGLSFWSALMFVINWIWPRERCAKSPTPPSKNLETTLTTPYKKPNRNRNNLFGCQQIGASSLLDSPTPSQLSLSSSSDDGGFLASGFDFRNRLLWRKPLIAYDSQMTIRSEGSGQSSRRNDDAYVQSQLRSIHEQYSRQLPSLRTIHCESYQNFAPAASRLPPLMTQPIRSSTQKALLMTTATMPSSTNYYHQQPQQQHHHHHNHRAPIVAKPELLLRPEHLLTIQASPESQSSSSGFGSKYTSSHQNHSSTNETDPNHFVREYWFEYPSRRQLAPIDVGSVDGHYEFDRLTPITTTPIPSTPTTTSYWREELDSSMLGVSPARKWSNARYDDIDARVQAMKEEFHEFRRRQAAAAAAGAAAVSSSSGHLVSSLGSNFF